MNRVSSVASSGSCYRRCRTVHCCVPPLPPHRFMAQNSLPPLHTVSPVSRPPPPLSEYTRSTYRSSPITSVSDTLETLHGSLVVFSPSLPAQCATKPHTSTISSLQVWEGREGGCGDANQAATTAAGASSIHHIRLCWWCIHITALVVWVVWCEWNNSGSLKWCISFCRKSQLCVCIPVSLCSQLVP